VLTEAELRALTTLRGEQTISELATQLDRSQSYTSELIDRLEATGLVESHRDGKRKQLRPANTAAFEQLSDLSLQYSHIEWPELLSGATLEVCYYLDAPRTSKALAALADVHRSTVHRSLEPLQHRGIVYETDDGEYALQEEFESVCELAKAIAHQSHRQTVESHTDTYTMLWESHDTFLVQVLDEIDADSFVLTGPERFQQYDLPLLARERRYYYYSEPPSGITPEILCCHMLCIDQGTRTQSYCLLLLSHVDVDREELQSQADRYGVTELVEDLLTYLETEGDQRTATLPPWEEFQSLAAEYGVTL
jgi:DNA-binding MarR family transcriptional regulator